MALNPQSLTFILTNHNPMTRKTRRLASMGRRRFVKYLSGIGVSAPLINNITTDGLLSITSDPNKEVPYIRRWVHSNHEEVTNGQKPDREPIYDTISRDKWVKVESAFDGARQLNTLLKKNFGQNTLVDAGVTKIGRNSEHAVVVNYSTLVEDTPMGTSVRETPTPSVEMVEDLAPSKINGVAGRDGEKSWTVQDIPVIVEQKERFDGGSCGDWYNTEYGDTIPAGTQIAMGNGSGGTTGSPAYAGGSLGNTMVSCAHVLNETNRVYQPDANVSNRDGTVVETTKNYYDDHGYFDDNNGEHFQHKLAHNNGGTKNLQIQGTVSWQTIKNNTGNENYTVKKQGGRTGVTQGHIKDSYNRGKRLFITAGSDRGDSGGPMYRTQNGNVYMVGVYAWSHNGKCGSGSNSDAGGNSMDYVEDYYGIAV